MTEQTQQQTEAQQLAERVEAAYRADVERWPETKGYVANMGGRLHVSLFNDDGEYVDSVLNDGEALKQAHVAVAIDDDPPLDDWDLLLDALGSVPEDVCTAVAREVEYQERRNAAGYGPPMLRGADLLDEAKAMGWLPG